MLERKGIQVWERERERERQRIQVEERDTHTGESEDTGVRDSETGVGEKKIKRDSGWERER